MEDEICVQLHEYMEELEFDCNDNGISDSDDIEFGTSSDDNGNGIPDECEEEASSTPDERQPEPSQIQLSIKPNPSHGENTTISLVLKEETSLSVDIYDASGRLVRNIIDQSLPADIHHLNWDGQDEHGLHAVTGIYFIRVVTEKDSYSKQLTLRR